MVIITGRALVGKVGTVPTRPATLQALLHPAIHSCTSNAPLDAGVCPESLERHSVLQCVVSARCAGDGIETVTGADLRHVCVALQ